ncbi:MAG: 30S ribosomal protein S15 [Lentisphaeria bacterium]|nr:30S ribosomal protein S15 [Lentisphaeria bacterium]
MKMEKAKKTEIVKNFARKEGDTGSPEVQIALLSERIAELTEHMRANKHDNSTRHGLMALVSRRKRLLKYLAKENHAKYLEIAEKFGIRGVVAK